MESDLREWAENVSRHIYKQVSLDGGQHEQESGGSSGSESKKKQFVPPTEWGNAPEFVPSFLLTEAIARTYPYSVITNASSSENLGSPVSDSTEEVFCPYFMIKKKCRFKKNCVNLHGEQCEFCRKFCLHPSDQVQRQKHTQECLEKSLAVGRSMEKTCGICYDVILEKDPSGQQRFGILPNCNHCFCLTCIRTWRKPNEFVPKKTIRACPECRIRSDFVLPSRHWIESEDVKKKLLCEYRECLSKKHCRNYKNGEGNCPFGNKCFYLHALPNGEVINVGPPKKKEQKPQEDTEQPGGWMNLMSFSVLAFLDEWEWDEDLSEEDDEESEHLTTELEDSDNFSFAGDDFDLLRFVLGPDDESND